eukprot:Hpha_TRINITY_DN16232_c0_g2::TRINITY_DN16232_c0_g2_i1::g.14395::m.14395
MNNVSPQRSSPYSKEDILLRHDDVLEELDADDPVAVQTPPAPPAQQSSAPPPAIEIGGCEDGDVNGVYTLTGDTHCGRGVWKKEEDGMMLFWSSGSGKWNVNDELDDGGFEEIVSNADLPIGLTGWRFGSTVGIPGAAPPAPGGGSAFGFVADAYSSPALPETSGGGSGGFGFVADSSPTHHDPPTTSFAFAASPPPTDPPAPEGGGG